VRAWIAFAIALAACGPDARGDDDGDDAPIDAPTCIGLQCAQVQCPGDGTTSVSGTVYAPNGTLPLYDVTVYVPNAPVGPLADGVQCDRCGGALSGEPLVKTVTDENGRFTLEDMPAALDVPLVIQVGKWRRQLVIDDVPACTDTPLSASATRMPRTQSEGDIPRIALTTGSADALECLLRKIGIADSEFSTAGGAGRIHLFAGGNPVNDTGGTDHFDAVTGGGATFAAATTLWDTEPHLAAYDIVLLSCEGQQNSGQKPPTAVAAMKAYADEGGRVFASHWHNYWLETAPAPWPSAITFDNTLTRLDSVTADVNTGFDRGASLAEWLVNVGASTEPARIDLENARHSVTGVDQDLVDKWIYMDTTINDVPAVQYLSFTAPLEDAAEERCGRVVFSDIHVTGSLTGDTSFTGTAFPSGGCVTPANQMSPQEKVLAFMIFDIASCVGPVVP
jgi:hypothetical protein